MSSRRELIPRAARHLVAEAQTLPFGDRLRALPIDSLWHLGP